MNSLLQRLLLKIPFVRDLKIQVSRQGVFPAGHFYSPIPDKTEALRLRLQLEAQNFSIPGIVLNEKDQETLLREFCAIFNKFPFPEKKAPGFRYYANNKLFNHADAFFLSCFIRKFAPKKIIEVGSGFSSAVMLDTVGQYLGSQPEIAFIEPYPIRLKSLLAEGDSTKATIWESGIQETDSRIFSQLASGDLLFIDSSHVMKTGSDLHHLFFKILPDVRPGVFVHFHDIFFPFEYPEMWIKTGMYWNEAYFLRAFLTDNSKWRIVFFNNFIGKKHFESLSQSFPQVAENPGGSLYLQKIA